MAFSITPPHHPGAWKHGRISAFIKGFSIPFSCQNNLEFKNKKYTEYKSSAPFLHDHY